MKPKSVLLLLALVLSIPGAMLAQTPTNGLVSWWQAQSNTLDTLNQNNGVAVGTVNYGTAGGGPAFSLNGSGYVSVANPTLVTNTGSFTVAAWIEISSYNQGASIINLRDPGNSSGFTLEQHYGFPGEVLWAVNQTGVGESFTMLTATNWQLNTLYHIAATFDAASGTMAIYQNGVLVAITNGVAHANMATNSADTFQIGHNIVASQFSWYGLIGDARYYDRALSASEIAALAGAGCECFNGMVSWWTGNGNASDLIGGNNGALMGGITFTNGEVGQAFSLDGTSGWVDISNSASLNPTGPFSVECWIKANPAQNFGNFLIVDKSHGFVDGTGWLLQGLTQDGTVAFSYGIGGSDGSASHFPYVITTNSVLDNQWHHLAGVWTGTQLQIYLDGVLQGEMAQTNPPVNNTRDVEIGRAWGGGSPTRFFHGLIDEVSYYNTALSAARISAIYQAGSAGKCNCHGSIAFSSCVTLTVLLSPAMTNALVSTNSFTNATTVVNGLVGWWKGDGDATDATGNNNGTAYNISYVPGQIGQAFSFDAQPYAGNPNVRRVDLSTVSQLYSATGLTVSAWVMMPPPVDPTSTNEWTYIYTDPAQTPNPDGSTNILLRGGGMFVAPPGLAHPRAVSYAIPMNDGTYPSLAATVPLPTNQWTHVAVTWSSASGQLQIYLNGALNNSASSAGLGKTLPTQAQRSLNGIPLTDLLGCWDFIPSSGTGSASLYGGGAITVDDFRLYDRPLAAAEIQNIYSLEPPVITNSVSTNYTTIAAVTTNLEFCPMPAGTLQIADTTPNQVSLFWPSQTNVWYLLQGSDELVPLDWLNLQGPGLGNGSLELVPDPTTTRPRRFYRLLSTQ